MEKEKILRQLEEKLLPSVQNMEKEQATEHDFFPALLWMLLEKIKDSENKVQAFENSNREVFKQTANYIVTKNQSFQNETNQVIDKDIANLYLKLDESLSKTAIQIINQYQTFQNETNQVIDKDIANLYLKLDESLSKTAIQIINQYQTFQNETNQVIDKDIANLYLKLDESLSKTAIQIINQYQTFQNETNQVIDKKFDEVIKTQEAQDIKSSKHFKWILGICIFQFITLTALIVFMLMR